MDTKHPLESYMIHLDFRSAILNDTISDFNLSALDDQGNAITIYSGLDIIDNIPNFRLSGGQNGRNYHITTTIETDDGSDYEQDFYLDVADRRKPIKAKMFQTGGTRKIGIYFGPVLNGQTIANYSLQAKDISTGLSADIVSSKGINQNGDTVCFLVHNLTSNNKDYVIYVIINDNANDPNTYVEEVYISVRNV